MANNVAGRNGLRFDKVATRVVDRLKAAARKTVPGGTTVVVTITAPIRLASKTTAVIEEKIETLRDQATTVHGNRIQIRVLRHDSTRAPKLIGYVHNPDADLRVLFEAARQLLRDSCGN